MMQNIQIFTEDFSTLTGVWEEDSQGWIRGWSIQYYNMTEDTDCDFCFINVLSYRTSYNIAMKIGYPPILYHPNQNLAFRFRTPEDALIIKMCWEDLYVEYPR